MLLPSPLHHTGPQARGGTPVLCAAWLCLAQPWGVTAGGSEYTELGGGLSTQGWGAACVHRAGGV